MRAHRSGIAVSVILQLTNRDRMSTYNRKGLAHSRKVLTSSLGATRQPRYSSVEPARLQTSARRRFNENVPTSSRASSVLTIREQNFRDYLPRLKENQKDISGAREIPLIFGSISKPSEAIARLIGKRKTDHDQAVNDMEKELATIQVACENEFKNRSASVKVQINGIRREIDRIRDELRGVNISDFTFRNDSKIAWIEVSASIDAEKQFIDSFYNNLLVIEKNRLENVKPVLKKYYKIFHVISHLMPYEIQVYLENQILNYNEIILANHRVYADLRLQMRLLAEFEIIKFKYWTEDLMKTVNRLHILTNDK